MNEHAGSILLSLAEKRGIALTGCGASLKACLLASRGTPETGS